MNQSKQTISSPQELEQAQKRLDELQQNPPQAGTDQERELRELRERVETYRRDNPDAARTPQGSQGQPGSQGSQGSQRR